MTLTQLNQLLDGWHAAAASSDEERYFGYFTKDAIFLGTDATERWELSALRAYAHPKFSAGDGWEMRATQRNISIGPEGVAWFDEALTTKNLGPARGSGVLLHQDGRWKIAHYSLTLTVPNERLFEVKALLAQ